MKKRFLFVSVASLFLMKGTATAMADSFALSSPAFSHQSDIPARYTCQGGEHQPALKWTNPPVGTKSYALIMEDPDAPRGTWIHWIVFNIPAGVTEFQENIEYFAQGEKQGMNSWEEHNIEGGKRGNVKYGGPCPPSGRHRYIFTIYALNCDLALSEGASKADLLKAMEDHTLGSAQLIGFYEKTKSHSHYTKAG